MVNASVRIHVQIRIVNQTRRIKNVVISVWNQLALLLTRVIVFAIHHVTLDANVMKDLFETNMEIASNPNSVQILIVHIMKFTQVGPKLVCVRSDNLFIFKVVLINVKKKIVIHEHVGIIIQFVKLDACAKRELFVI